MTAYPGCPQPFPYPPDPFSHPLRLPRVARRGGASFLGWFDFARVGVTRLLWSSVSDINTFGKQHVAVLPFYGSVYPSLLGGASVADTGQWSQCKSERRKKVRVELMIDTRIALPFLRVTGPSHS